MANYLCVCQYGHSRSVALTRILHHRGHNAIALGWMTSPNAIPLLTAWADAIYILQPYMLEHIPPEHHHKTRTIDVGPDIWCNPFNPELHDLLTKLLDTPTPPPT